MTFRRRAPLPALALLALAAAPSARAEILAVDCGAGATLQAAVDRARPGDVIRVSGTCSPGAEIPTELTRVTLDGQGTASIAAAAGKDSVFIRGRDITVRGFTMTGGRDGVHLSGQGSGASAVIEDNVIRAVGRRGINLDQTSVARIAGNLIERPGAEGINVQEVSTARIGYVIAPVKPNRITEAGTDGIVVTVGASARIVGNLIAGAKRHGVLATRQSHVDLWANRIAGNGGDGLHLSAGSGVAFSPDGMPRADGPPAAEGAAAAPNAGYGIACRLTGYVDGPPGELAGAKGARDLDPGCAARLE